MTTSGQKWSVFSFLLVKKIPKIRGFPLISQELLGISERSFHHSLKLVDARILKKKSGQNSYWLPRYSSRRTEDDDFPGFFHCFTANNWILLFNGLEFGVGDFFIVCRISRASFVVQTVLQNSKRLPRYSMFPEES